MKTKKTLILGIFCFAIAIQIGAQVTIGSHLPPLKGSLLDIKEYNSEGATADKGVAMPRVSLSDLKNLYPMFDVDDADYQQNKEAIDNVHTGLIVYNVNKVQSDPCDFTVSPIKAGLYLWNGTEWSNLSSPKEVNTDDDVMHINVRNPAVKIFYDERNGIKEPYTCRKFGDAGVWMTMNMRATTYSKNNTQISATISAYNNDPDFNDNISKKKKAIYTTPYPKYDENNRPYRGFDDRWLKKNPLVGYLYNYRAMMGGIIGGDTNNRQGICPDNWHVPTLQEYEKLRDVILDDPEPYLLRDTQGNYPDKTKRKFADALMVHCSPFQGSDGDRIIQGYSKSYSDGGFGAFSVGTVMVGWIYSSAFRKDSHSFPVNDGLKEDVHTGSLGPDPTSPTYKKPRNINLSWTYGPNSAVVEAFRGPGWAEETFAFPVRCKKNNDNLDDL